jgi:ribokinase
MRLLIDTDPGIDDALALVMALTSPDAEVMAICTVAGNVPVDQATTNALRILAAVDPGSHPRVARGAEAPLKRALVTAGHIHGDDGLGNLDRYVEPDGRPRYPKPAPVIEMHDGADVILDLADRLREELVVVALGPLTNLALALQRGRRVLSRVGRIVVMGGAVAVPGNVTPGAEFNFYVDPEAAAAVFKAGLPIDLVPLDVTNQVVLPQAELARRLAACSSSLGRFVADFSLHGFAVGRRKSGMILHDPLAWAWPSIPPWWAPGLARGDRVRGRATRALARGPPRAPVASPKRRPNCRVATTVDGPLSSSSSGPPVPRVAVIGSANVDFTVALSRLPRPGETVSGGTLLVNHGGKGANQAVAARRLGAEVRMIGCIGADSSGAQIHARLAEQGIGVEGLMSVSEAATGTALIAVDGEGRNQIGVAPGANHRLTVAMAQAHEAVIAWAEVLLCQLEVPLVVVRWALETARRHEVLTILNPAPAQPLGDEVLALATYLTPNEGEAGALSGRPVDDLDSAREAAERLAARGAGRVLVTLGGRGILALDGGTALHFPAFPITPVDTTAAGDAFNGALAVGLAAGGDLEQAVPLASAAAALACTKRGAQDSLPYRADVEAYLQSLRRA